MKKLLKRCVGALFGSLVLAGVNVVQAETPTSLKILNPEDISGVSRSPNGHLWFSSGPNVVEAVFVDGHWQSQRQISLRDKYVNSTIQTMAATNSHLWTFVEQKVHVDELTTTPPYLKNFKNIAIPNNLPSNPDLETALDDSGVTVSSFNTVYVGDISAGEIHFKQIDNAGCNSIRGVKRTKDWLIFSCNWAASYVYQYVNGEYKFVNSLPGRLLFLNATAQSATVFDRQNYSVSTYNLKDLTLLHAIPNIEETYQSSDNSLVLVKHSNSAYITFLRVTADGKRSHEFAIDNALYMARDSVFNPESLTSSLIEAGDKIFRGFEYWQKNEMLDQYDYRGNDWQHKLGLSNKIMLSVPAQNAFISGGNAKQIWYAPQGEIPKLQGDIQLLSETFRTLPIERATQHNNTWWVAGFDSQSAKIVLKQWTAGQTFAQIEFAVPPYSGVVNQLFYDANSDTLLVAQANTNLLSCQQAMNLRAASQCQLLSTDRPAIAMFGTEHGVLLFHRASDNKVDAVMHNLTPSGQQERWRTQLEDSGFEAGLLYTKDQYLLTTRGEVLLLTGSQQGSVRRLDDKRFPPGCYFRAARDLFCPAYGMTLYRFNDDLSRVIGLQFNGVDSPFRQKYFFHLDNSDQILFAENDTVTQHQLTLPMMVPTSHLIPKTVLQDQSLIIDARQLYGSLSGATVKFDAKSTPPPFGVDKIVQEIGDLRWQFNTINAVAIYNPTLIASITLTEGNWVASDVHTIKLHNVNDAPSLKQGSYVNNLKIGEQYLLEFSDVFEDIDNDRLTYSVDRLPPGFEWRETSIVALPTTPASYQFTVTATDPAGASVSAVFSGRIGNTDDLGSDKGSGGSVHWLALFGLLMLRAVRCHKKQQKQAGG